SAIPAEVLPYLPKFHDGMKIEVLTPENQLIYIGRLEVIRPGVLQVHEDEGSRLPPVVYGTELKLRGFHENMETFVLFAKVTGSNEQMMQLDELRPLTSENRRNFYRQSLHIEAQVLCANSIYDPMRGVETKPQECVLLDLSGGGARISCPEPYEMGDWLLLRNVVVNEGEEPFDFTCRVRRVVPGRRGMLHGLEFDSLDPKDRDRLMRSLMIAQRLSRQNKRSFGDR
ncbi:MAG: PilZ domain-containing protein, partial [Clostridia bacterium]|nr:PilZ domain-containing protein [Clostridia bacterium]